MAPAFEAVVNGPTMKGADACCSFSAGQAEPESLTTAVTEMETIEEAGVLIPAKEKDIIFIDYNC